MWSKFKYWTKQKKSKTKKKIRWNPSDQEIAEDAYERIVDSVIEESFGNILSTSKNTKNYFDSLDSFTNFDKKLIKYKNNLNIASKS